MPFLQVTDLVVRYPGRPPALDGVSFSLEAGEVVGVSGVSGCGKTTLALALMGLLSPDAAVSGSIRLGDRELIALAPQDYDAIRGSRIGIVFQESALALNPLRTVGRQIADVVLAHERCSRTVATRRALAALEDVGFDDDRSRIFEAYPHELSGGQRQRILIAQAIICRPSLIIADEPVASLDGNARAGILGLIQQVNERFGIAFLLITHSAEVLDTVARRVLTIDAGHIVDGRRQTAAPPVPVAPRAAGKARSATAPPLLEVSDAVKNYAQTRLLGARYLVEALRGADLRLNAGETLGVTGPSGCGKSTLARCIAGLERLDAGHIRVDGANVGALCWRLLRRNHVQLIFQDSVAALNPRFTAFDIVTEAMVIRRQGTAQDRGRRAAELLEQVGLPADRLLSRAREFSGGERQRLAIARALAVSPRLLILDEAFSGLDLDTRERMVRLLKELQAAHGLTYICISHDLALLSDFASQVVVMREGRVDEHLSPAAMREAHQRLTRAASPSGVPGTGRALSSVGDGGGPSTPPPAGTTRTSTRAVA